MNKNLLLASLVVALFPLHSALRAESDPASQEVAKTRLGELEALRAEYARRRTDALREVDSWYRSRLEGLLDALSEQSTGEKAEIMEAIADAKEKF
jgi:hypothetical protein